MTRSSRRPFESSRSSSRPRPRLRGAAQHPVSSSGSPATDLMLRGRKNALAAEVAALREEVRELRRAVEQARHQTPLPGEGDVVETVVEEAMHIAGERHDLARQLADAKRELAEIKRQRTNS